MKREDFSGTDAIQAYDVCSWFYSKFAEPIADTSNDDFNDETDFIAPLIHGIKHAKHKNTPGKGAIINISVDSLKRDLFYHRVYGEYSKRNYLKRGSYKKK